MKKVLIIGHFWPYRGGSKRIIGLAKYLKDFDWEPIVLTGFLKQKPEPNFRYIEDSYCGFLGKWGKILGINPNFSVSDQFKEKLNNRKSSVIKSLLRFLYRRFAEILAFPDEDKYWKKNALEAATQLFKTEKIDAVMSVWPQTSHIIAKELKIKYKIPWIADFPDLWSQNYDYPYSLLRRNFDRNIEQETIKSADVLTTVSDGLAYRLKELHKGKKIYSITHGFDPKEVNIKPVSLTPKFTITYTGQIYKRKQNPSKVLIALKELINQGIIESEKFSIRFYGSVNAFLEEEIKKYKLSSIAKQYGIVPHEEAIKRQQESHLLLLLNWEDKNQKGVYTGKIFEYFAARRPIIVTGGIKGDVIDILIRKTNSGTVTFTIEDIKQAIKNYYLEYERAGQIAYKGNLSEISKYSVVEMAKKFSEILDKIT